MSNQSPTLAYDLDRDVRVLSAMASNLTPYLYENEMYGYLSGGLPKLTLGGLLMRLYRLSRLESHLDAEQQDTVQNARLNFEAERSEWAVHYDTKLQHETGVRLNALERFLNECNDDPQDCASGYPSQAEKRIMIEHLRLEAEERDVLTDELRTHLKQVDNKLQRLLGEGEFITDERLKEIYPRSQFWWMYGHVGEK